MVTDSTYTTSYQDSQTVNLHAVITKYFKYWPWFLLSVATALSGAYIYLLCQKNIYSIQAKVLILDEGGEENNNKVLQDFGLLVPKKVMDNEIEALGSLTLMTRAVKKLDANIFYLKPGTFIAQDLYSKSPIKLIIEKDQAELYKQPLEISFFDKRTVRIGDQLYPLNQRIQTPYGRLKILSNTPVDQKTGSLLIQVVKPTAVARKYLGSLSIIPTTKASTVLLLMLEDAVPDRGEAVLNQLIEEYNQETINNKNQVANSTLDFIQKRLDVVSSELAIVEKKVERYKARQGITDLGVQGQSFLQAVQQNDAQLNQVNIQLAALSDLQKYMNTQPDKQAAIPATMGLNDPILVSLISKLTQLESQRDQIERTTSDKNPLLQTLNSQLLATKDNIKENVMTLKNALTSSRQQSMDKNAKLENIIRTIPQKERELLNITRQQSIKNGLYTYLLQKREETAVSFGTATSDSQLIDAAESSSEPVKPVKATIYTLFCLIGLILPIGTIAGRDLLNNKITRRIDVEGTTPVPILGEIVKKRSPEALVITHNSLSVAAEQIQMLRSNLQFLQKSVVENQVLLFTSSISGEGKSFVSLNLGASMALVGQPTVILDVDLRRPKLHQLLNLPNTTGVSEFLKDEATLDDILKPVPGYPNYYVILSGQLPDNPSILLSNPRVQTLIQKLRHRFTYILIDTPPSGLVTDAQLISSVADVTLFLVRHDLTLKSHLKILNSLHQGQRFQNLNIILNAVTETDINYYSYTHKSGYSYKRPYKV